MTRPVPLPQEPDGTKYGTRGAVATSHPLAVQAGARMLAEGGSAADAAVAVAAALTVVEPTSNGIGGDAFAIVWAEGKLHGLNGSGRSPRALERSAIPAGASEFPSRGWLPVTVPGAPAAWRDLHGRFGRLPFDRVLAPAIELAEHGHPVAPLVARFWARAAEAYAEFNGPEFSGWPGTFLFKGRPPETGERVRLPDHADTLRRLAMSRAEDFYKGHVARRIDAFARETGGLLRKEDLEAHESLWVNPLSVSYRDAELWELPPNGQGIVALEALGILSGLDASKDWDDAHDTHEAIEALKLAFEDAEAIVADPRNVPSPPERLLEENALQERRSKIDDKARGPKPHPWDLGGTVYLATADQDGMFVSYIQSNYMGFGSGVVVPGTGIALQNRGSCFSLDPAHPNCVAPEKRPLQTIIPGFLTRSGEPWGPVGVMGGFMQPQGHVQVVRSLVDRGLTPQAALDLPRWRWTGGLDVLFEPGWPEETLEDIEKRGHSVTRASNPWPFGRGQMILRGKNGVFAAGSDRRADGLALAL